jgi:mannose-6-phosphate isomerase-like protein (cupin superfamily)
LTATLTDPLPQPLATTAPGHVRLDAGPGDIAALNRMVCDGAQAGNEHPADAGRLDQVIPKPWGYELRAFADEYFDVWTLAIGPGHATSLHVHPRKLTYLICLDGDGATAGLGGEIPVGTGTIMRIAPGAFHSTKNTGCGPLHLVEVEVPRNKLDLLRLADGYSREGTGYETGFRALADLPLREVRHRPNTRMRDRTPDGLFRFSLRTGMDLYYRRGLPGDICHVPLCMSGVVGGDIEILAAGSGQAPDTGRTYLCISRAA